MYRTMSGGKMQKVYYIVKKNYAFSLFCTTYAKAWGKYLRHIIHNSLTYI